ncbi:uncharacterized protein MONOS_9070 [Monocercomonoides exilis]|uniref:uncharacterized protein n=1 Tax=Monocercomonoides exilis TaxID=2049356 RepID=UPI0035593BA8|nr:hypothetical protein MONOS_9070 [Monocercomonoides exilis]|eukprot:MONOS_9070.1-p1 / transcript=MONOS_9070.1 / gene=MONOS_9070 / organism=Monocercomonoides_exilis_PA203 / gene_product=unspecified product / transcript_product=unspecified product / location=Mono_scaffold00362:11872-13401(-) / protein_length=463 / sequence_SO=supercontig / SO=protein_coding / is_pseudo=false
MTSGATKETFSLCNFTNITSSKNYSTVFSAGNLPKSLALNNCSISSISSLNSIGTNVDALSLNADDSQICFSNTTFTSCYVSSSNGGGGSLYFSTSGSLSKISISSCKFSLNEVYFGRDVFIFVPSLPNANLDSYYSAAATSTYVPNRTNAWSITQAVQLLNGSSPTIKANGTVTVSSSGTDVSNVAIRRNESTVNATVTIDRIAGTANSALISSGAFQSRNIVYSIGSVHQGSLVQRLLSESESTVYILGRDSDKIPQWMLEKIDEKEIEDETRKRTPSPSISSTLTTDSDSSFIREEDLCPTTSSMSSFVDGMARESPYEKMIVDLRDSLFMLLHGKNEKKEMAIGTMEQREATAVQILFWVANGALHSFEQDRGLSFCLDSLSPHIVLFSEHMVVVIALNSGFSSEDSGDLSSVDSSSTDGLSSISYCEGNKCYEKREKKEKTKSSAFEDETIDNENLQ